ncbi:hypothetical protein E2562_002663 [Oryza meyeriana var. granulata]|uniref:Uncharacterized protein n=1 Tax=Oryza meyeriana var. granulata TaxID=110450 RepID=A0A6G1BQY2_9ORYZ|nr:hypothetical protein E2562_002663 [Oryza meyeriana var. granulata]
MSHLFLPQGCTSRVLFRAVSFLLHATLPSCSTVSWPFLYPGPFAPCRYGRWRDSFSLQSHLHVGHATEEAPYRHVWRCHIECSESARGANDCDATPPHILARQATVMLGASLQASRRLKRTNGGSREPVPIAVEQAGSYTSTFRDFAAGVDHLEEADDSAWHVCRAADEGIGEIERLQGTG